MKKGEKAILTISPDYGYGAAGAGGVYPFTMYISDMSICRVNFLNTEPLLQACPIRTSDVWD